MGFSVFSLSDYFSWSGWMLVVFILARGHFASACMTLYLHRSQTHQSVKFAGWLDHFFRFFTWFLMATRTKEWVAIHRKHHVEVDKYKDPHSPRFFGLPTVFFLGWRLYQEESHKEETLRLYGTGAPNDWVENNLYTPHKYWGIFILLALDLLVFGWWGLLTWGCQMIWIPFWAAGVVNGLGHYPSLLVGYRNYNTEDESTNIMPLAMWPLGFVVWVFTCGEGLHNNHHDKKTSARLSGKWWEFDPGWLYIVVLKKFGLARLRTAPVVTA